MYYYTVTACIIIILSFYHYSILFKFWKKINKVVEVKMVLRIHHCEEGYNYEREVIQADWQNNYGSSLRTGTLF